MEVDPLRRFLFRLAKNLTNDELDDMKYLLNLPEGIAERIKTPRDLFQELTKQHRTDSAIACLSGLLDELGRIDLVKQLNDYVEEQRARGSGLPKSCSWSSHETNESGVGSLPQSPSSDDHSQVQRGSSASAPNTPPQDQNASMFSLRDERSELCSQLQPSAPDQSATANHVKNNGQLVGRSQSESRIPAEDIYKSENAFRARNSIESRRQTQSCGRSQFRGEQRIEKQSFDLENAVASNTEPKKIFAYNEKRHSLDMEKSGNNIVELVDEEQFENTALKISKHFNPAESGEENAKQIVNSLSNSGVLSSLPRNDSETELKQLYVSEPAKHSHNSRSSKQLVPRNANETELKQVYDINRTSNDTELKQVCDIRRSAQVSEFRDVAAEHHISGENVVSSVNGFTSVDVESCYKFTDLDSDGPPSVNRGARQSKNTSRTVQDFDLSQYLPRSKSSIDHDPLRACLPQLFSPGVSLAVSDYNPGGLELNQHSDLNAFSAEHIEAQMLGESRTPTSNILQRLLAKNRSRKAAGTICMRNYQKELATPGTQGKNCIICAPTGSGKTLTAGYICQCRRMNAAIERRPFKTLFIVCIRNLIMQQRDALSQIVVSEDGGEEVVGALNETALLSEYLKKFDLVVLTAQILVNCLKNNEVRLGDIDLLIMDECHHTTLNHPYSMIMLEYHRQRQLNPSGKLPQVIGLTASLGVGSAGDSQSGALYHYIRLCANLDCSSVTHVKKKEHLNELLYYNPKPKKDQIIAVDPRSATSGLYEVLGSMMSEIEQITVFPLAKTSFPIGTQQYENWIIQQRMEAESKGLIDAITCTETLQRLNGALMLYDELRARDAKCYLDSFFAENFTSPSRRPTYLMIKQLYAGVKSRMDAVVEQELVSDNPKLDHLCSLLTDLYTSNNEAKGIILTRTRLSVEVLLNCIKELPKLKGIVSPMKLIGQGGKDGRMTDVEQENTLRCFRLERETPASCNLLIATDVAQEGLDMPKCNFVIRYNFVSNEIGSVQSRGRARAPNSECYLIVERNSVNEKREIQNLEKEHMMLQALEDIDEIEEEKLKVAIQIEQARILEEHEVKMQEKKAMAHLLNAENVTIHCRSCKLELCQATDMRLRMNNYICIADDSFLMKIFIRKLETPDEYRFDSKIGLCVCTACHKIVGSQLQYKRGNRKYGYVLSKNNVMWKYGEEENYQKIKKWSAVPFEIREESMFPNVTC